MVVVGDDAYSGGTHLGGDGNGGTGIMAVFINGVSLNGVADGGNGGGGCARECNNGANGGCSKDQCVGRRRHNDEGYLPSANSDITNDIHLY